MRIAPAHASTASLLVAALVMLRHPCSRSRATAQLLLERAAEHCELTPAEREACRTLADDLDRERPEPAGMPTKPAVSSPPAASLGPERRTSPAPLPAPTRDINESLA